MVVPGGTAGLHAAFWNRAHLGGRCFVGSLSSSYRGEIVTLPIIIALLLSQVSMVAGQVFLKKSMAETPSPKHFPSWAVFAGGIFFLALWFFLWLGLMSQLDLSQQMPLEAISPILIMAAGVLFLKEKCGWRGWLGLLLTAVGVYVVASS